MKVEDLGGHVSHLKGEAVEQDLKCMPSACILLVFVLTCFFCFYAPAT